MTVARSPNSKSNMKTTKRNPQPHKRNSNPYDSQNGITCHQCRHKMYGAYVNCKNQAKTKPCTGRYCRTCLLNRYGKKVEDVLLLDKWDCPKCKGVCNCSMCMKKRGHQPTGKQMAKAGGFSSDSDLIVAKGAQNVSNYMRVKEATASPRNLAALAEGITITSPKKPGKENLFDGKTELNANPPVSVSSSVNKKPKKSKRKGFEVKFDGSGVNEVLVNETNNAPNEKKQKKLEAVIPLPTGNELVTIAGVDLPKEDAGNALQLLEFSATFGEILDVKKGQAEAVLRDLGKGRSTRRGKFTSVVQFNIQLLSVIQEESGSESESESESESSDMTHGNDSWLKALKSCISKSKLKDIDIIDMPAGGYDDLDSSKKLRLLVFLCDEVLGTEKIRNWIDDQNAKFFEKRKEAKDKLCVAKEKEKSLKRKMQDDIAEAIIEKEGVPLTIKEHDAIVSKIKDEVAEAHAEMLASKKLVSTDEERPDALRTEPIFRDNNGHVFWRLKGCPEKPGILQDIGTGDHTIEAVDRWFEYDDEQMDLIEKDINVLRSRFRKHYKN